MSIRNHLQACCLALRDFPSGLEHLQRGFVLVRSMEGLGRTAQNLLGMMKDEHRKWRRVLLDEQDAGIKQHLVTLKRLFQEYFDQSDQEYTETLSILESKVKSLPDRC